MKKAKNQHYVPQSYLKRFTYDGDRLFVFDKATQRTFASNVKGVASERYFYDFSNELMEEMFSSPENIEELTKELGTDPEELQNILSGQIVETSLNSIETAFATACETLLRELTIKRKKKGPLRRRIIFKQQKIALAQFLAIQFLRTKEYRLGFKELLEKVNLLRLWLLLKAKMSGEDPDDYTLQMNENVLAVQHAALLFDPNYLATLVEVLSSHIWILAVNETDTTFFTSDNPIVRRGHIQHPLMGTDGLGSRGVEIAFPLSPRVILVMYERTHFHEYQHLDGRALPLNDSESIKYYNRLQVLQSTRQVFSRVDDFKLAVEICKRYPHVSQIHRRRVSARHGNIEL